MRAALEALVFSALAVGLMLAGLAIWRHDSGVASGGSGGQALITLAAATPELARMVEEWDAPPPQAKAPRSVLRATPPAALAPRLAPLAQGVALPDAPKPPEPSAPRELALMAPQDPVRPAKPEPEPEPEPQLEPEPAPAPEPELASKTAVSDMPPPPTKPTPPPKPVAKADPRPEPTPKPKPKPKPDPAAKPAAREAQAAETARKGAGEEERRAQRAAGSGGGAAAGDGAPGEVASNDPGRDSQLLAVWGARIRSEVERKKRNVRGLRARGTAVVSLTVSADGTLIAHRLTRSSGVSPLDAAALRAVALAAPFSAAPGELGPSPRKFLLPVRFN